MLAKKEKREKILINFLEIVGVSSGMLAGMLIVNKMLLLAFVLQ